MPRIDLSLNYDQSELALIRQNTSGTWTTANIDLPKVTRNNDYLLKLQVYDDAPTAANLSAINTSSWQYDLGLLGTAPVITLDSTSFNTDGWANTTAGKITVNINTHSTSLTTAIGTDKYKTYYQQITGLDDAVGNQNLTVVFESLVSNVVGASS